MASAKKENKVERVKRERDGLDCRAEILRYAREGFGSIDPEDLDVRLRWYGLYTQRPQEDGLFMLRVKVPGGTLSSRQLETLGRLSLAYARNAGDVTTRQDIQLHNVRIEDVPAIFEELERVGLTTSGACGDITRNVTGCPLAGLANDELFDVTDRVAMGGWGDDDIGALLMAMSTAMADEVAHLAELPGWTAAQLAPAM